MANGVLVADEGIKYYTTSLGVLDEIMIGDMATRNSFLFICNDRIKIKYSEMDINRNAISATVNISYNKSTKSLSIYTLTSYDYEYDYEYEYGSKCESITKYMKLLAEMDISDELNLQNQYAQSSDVCYRILQVVRDYKEKMGDYIDLHI